MDGFHWTDLLVLVALGLLIFGPKQLPEIGSSVGAMLRELKRSVREEAPSGSHSTTASATDTTPASLGEDDQDIESAPPDVADPSNAGETRHTENKWKTRPLACASHVCQIAPDSLEAEQQDTKG